MKFWGLTNTSLYKFNSTFDIEIKIIHEWITDENRQSIYEFKSQMKTKAYDIFKKNYAELGKKHFYKIRSFKNSKAVV